MKTPFLDDDHVKTMTLLELSPSYQQEDSLEPVITSTSGAAKVPSKIQKEPIRVETSPVKDVEFSDMGVDLNDLDVDLSTFKDT